MYIGDTAERGLHHLVFEVVDNSIDEALAGYCTRIAVTIHIDSSVTVEDNGRGIPVEMHPTEGVSAAEVVLTKLHAGGKFDKGAYKVSGGLHGVGVSVVNALSETLEVEIKRDGKVYVQRYHRGEPETPLQEIGATDQRGTKVTFKPDPLIFETTDFSFDILSQRLRELAFLNRGVHITIEDERDQKSHEFLYEGGIVAFVEHLNRAKTPIHPDVIYLQGTRDGVEVEIALQWNEGYAENVYAFANNINTIEGGTHLIGFKSALTRTINTYAAAQRPAQEGRRGAAGRRRPRGPDRGHQRQGARAAVRGADEDQARQQRGEGHRRGAGERAARRSTSRSTRPRRKRIVAEGPRGGARARGDAQGEGARAPQGRARRRRRCPASSPTARSAIRRSPSSSSSRAIRPAARRSRAATGKNQAILPLRGKILNVEKARFDKMLSSQEIKLLITALGAGIGTRRQGPREAALPHDHHHDRRRRRRRAHPDAAADVLLPALPGAHRAAATSSSRSRRSTA